MKKLILALIAIGFAVIISSCCDQTRESCKRKAEVKKECKRADSSAHLNDKIERITENPPQRVHRKW